LVLVLDGELDILDWRVKTLGFFIEKLDWM